MKNLGRPSLEIFQEKMTILNSNAILCSSEGSESTLKKFLKPEFLKPFAYLFVVICLIEWSSFPFWAFYLVIFLKVSLN